MEFKISRAAFEQAGSVAPLFDAYRRFYGQNTDLPGARAFLEDRLKAGESVIFAAADSSNGRIAGFTQLYPTFSSVSMRRAWILNDLFVDPQDRGQGIGRLLLEAARKHALETGAKGLALSTAVDNFTAQKLYESFGFVRDQKFYHYEWLS